MIRSGHTNKEGHRRGKHVSGAFGVARAVETGNPVNDAYTRDNDQPINRARTTRAWTEAIKWAEGKSVKEMIAAGIAMGNWE